MTQNAHDWLALWPTSTWVSRAPPLPRMDAWPCSLMVPHGLPDDLSPEQLLAHLNPEQRKAFEALLADPERAAELLQEEDAPLDPQQFWWYRSTLDADVDQKDRKGKGRERPKPIPKDKLLQSTASSELDLGHNLVAIL